MKIGFIGTGRMGQAMVLRLLDGKHDVGVYNRTPAKIAGLIDAGAKAMTELGDAANFGDAVFTMLADDAALADVANQSGGLLETLPKGGIHICSGTHGIPAIRALKAAHAERDQVLITAPILGRPEVVTAGNASISVAGPQEPVTNCESLFTAISGRMVKAGADPEASTAIKIANNFVLGCAIEAMGEGFSLVRKYGVEPQTFLEVLTSGLFAAPAYSVYGKIIVDESYDKVGQMALLGLKDANLALAAGELVGVPLPSGNVWRDRLVGAVAYGDGDKDWAVMARVQARASGLE